MYIASINFIRIAKVMGLFGERRQAGFLLRSLIDPFLEPYRLLSTGGLAIYWQNINAYI